MLALGLLVDDSIVVVENIARYLRAGYSRARRRSPRTDQIALAVLGCTATLLFAFLPLLFLPEGAGMFIRSLPAAVLYTVAASLLRRADHHPVPREPHAQGQSRQASTGNRAAAAR